MLATVLLQRGAVPLPAAAAISIIRANNTGPWSLLGKMEVEWHRGSALLGLITALLTLTTLSLQFTSTVLLSQVGIASLPVASSKPQTHYGIKTDGDTYWAMPSGAPSLLGLTPERYPAFAEWTPNKTRHYTAGHQEAFSPSNLSSIVDTGTVLRAFLPINNDQERSLVTEYHGFATVVDTRVVCMRPNLTNVTFSTGHGYHVTGLANIQKKPLGYIQKEDPNGNKNFSIYFDCGFAVSVGGNYSEPDWPLAFCLGQFDNSFQGVYSFIQSKQERDPGPSYIIVNATQLEAVGDLDDSGVWESITISDPGFMDVLLQVTLCMTTFQAQRMEVNATRTTPILPEPSLVWDVPTTKWNTKAVIKQLGAITSEMSTAERGIFDLAPRSWQWRINSSDSSAEAMETTDGLDGVGLDPLYAGMTNSAQFSIFSDVLMSTKNPALALQAYLTRLCSICFYDRITMFDAVGPSVQVFLVQVTQPLGWTAFIIVVVASVAHLILVLLVIFIFRRSGTLSGIQNAWASISQLLGPVTEDWIRDTDTVNDKTVKLWLKDRGLHKTLVGIERVQSRVHLVDKEKAL
ncbi:hypothetical protein BFJ70_g16733 [Fusarium oxysporum]|nr:hypothetical protein BFJ70_g16733 [Fusarium oxysporum]